jgi:hypothetical protein
VKHTQEISRLRQTMFDCSARSGASYDSDWIGLLGNSMHKMLREPLPRRPQAKPADRELTLGEMLADPIVIRLMRRDGVVSAEVAALFNAQSELPLCCAG